MLVKDIFSKLTDILDDLKNRKVAVDVVIIVTIIFIVSVNYAFDDYQKNNKYV